MTKYLFFLLLLTASIHADIAVTSEARKGLFLTVYRDFGVIKDVRTVDFPKGNNKIRFEEVAASIRSSSVYLEFPENSSLELLGQNYEFDLISPAKLLEKYVGKTLEIVPRKGNWPDTSVQTAELISIHGEEPVFRIGTKITFGNIGQIMFPYMPDNMYTKPTLIWDINSPRRQSAEITATYIAERISWNAGYVIFIDKKDNGGSFSGWLEFDNRTGLDYGNANVTFVAGDVNRIRDRDSQKSEQLRKLIDVGRESGDFYLYTVTRPVSLPDNRIKQIEWIPRVHVKFKPVHILEFLPDSANPDRNNRCAGTAIEIENNENNGLGMPLPPGIVRVFRKDAQNNWFMGEDYVGDIPVKKSFIIRTGSMHDITATKYIDQKKRLENEENREIVIANNRGKDVILKVRDFVANGKIINNNVNYIRINPSIAEWEISIKAYQTYTLSYTVKKG